MPGSAFHTGGPETSNPHQSALSWSRAALFRGGGVARMPPRCLIGLALGSPAPEAPHLAEALLGSLGLGVTGGHGAAHQAQVVPGLMYQPQESRETSGLGPLALTGAHLAVQSPQIGRRGFPDHRGWSWWAQLVRGLPHCLCPSSYALDSSLSHGKDADEHSDPGL